jgi:hypothetical protein
MVTHGTLQRSVQSLAIAAALLGATTASRADEPPPSQASPATSAQIVATPRVHHAPIATARAHEELRVAATIDSPELVRSAGVVYRAAKGELRIVPMLRSEGGGYLGVIPANEVAAPGLGYTIEIERLDGTRVPAFASRVDLQPVVVMDDRMDVRERALLKRLGGRRSVVSAGGEYVRFGTTTGTQAIACARGQADCPAGTSRVPSVNDQYWRVEVGYTYRPLRTVAEFGIRIGVVRGTSLVDLHELDEDKYKVGLNYAAPSVRFRLADAWHVEVGLLASITEIGFSLGGGTSLLIGDPYGTRLTLGVETIGFVKSTYFGTRIWSRLDILVREGFTVGPTIEVTDMPHADSFGVRLLADANVSLGHGFSLGARGGYQARRSTSGGVALGGTAAFAF